MDPLKLNGLMIELLEVLHEQSVELDHAFEQVGRTAGRVPESRNLTMTSSRLAELQLRARQMQDEWIRAALGGGQQLRRDSSTRQQTPSDAVLE